MEFIFLILNKTKKEWLFFAEFEYIETDLFIFLTLKKSKKW